MKDPEQSLPAKAAAEIAAATATLISEHDVVGTATEVIGRCVRVTAASSAGVLLADPETGGLDFLAATSHQAEHLELLQVLQDDGPASEVIRTGRALTFSQSELLDRWPPLGRGVRAAGLQAVHASPMTWQGTTVGALNLFFADEPSTVEMAPVARAFADLGTLAIVLGREAGEIDVLTRVRDALTERLVIELAKGVIAHAEGIEVAEAFDRLVARAASQGQPLTQAAQAVVDAAERSADKRGES